MLSPFDPPSGSNPPPPPLPPPGHVPPPAPSGLVPPPLLGASPPPPGYQAYSPMSIVNSPRAGFGQRLGGWILDTVLYGILGFVLVTPGFVLLLRSGRECEIVGDVACVTGGGRDALVALSLFMMAAGGLIVLGMYIRALGRTGQTWGRRIVGVKVVGEMSGEPIGIGGAIGRQLFASLFSGQILYLGYLWMLWDDKQQTWHDKVASSIVIKV